VSIQVTEGLGNTWAGITENPSVLKQLDHLVRGPCGEGSDT